MSIRAVRAAEASLLQEIEVEAGRLFRDIGMDQVASDEPAPAEHLLAYIEAGHAWCACDDRDTPIGYLLAEPVDGDLHVEQVSVRPGHARRGIGRSLIEHAAAVAADSGYPALTLTTFRDVPWNGPYYSRLGFVPITAPGPGLRAIRDLERAHGLDRWPRLCMRKTL